MTTDVLAAILAASGAVVSPVVIQYVKTDYTDGVDFTITTETTGQTLWTESNVNAAAVKAPRQARPPPAQWRPCPAHAGTGGCGGGRGP